MNPTSCEPHREDEIVIEHGRAPIMTKVYTLWRGIGYYLMSYFVLEEKN